LARVALGIDVGIQPADVGQHEPLSVRALQPDVRGRVHAHAVRDRVDLVWHARDAQTGITALERRHDPLPRIVQREPRGREDVRLPGDQQGNVEVDVTLLAIDRHTVDHRERTREKYRYR